MWANYVSGEMTASQRRVRLRELRTIDTDHRGLLSNARCLTEGVDVPTLDGVVFVDPKRSEVDIVQAVGRAIRLADDKTVGTIVIPVFMASDEDHEIILDDSSFKTVWEVVKALRMHDEELAEQLDSLRLGLGQRGAGQPRLPRRSTSTCPPTSAPTSRGPSTCAWSTASPRPGWSGSVGFRNTTKLPELPLCQRITKLPTVFQLGQWAATQRVLYKRGKLSADRIEMLNNLGDWRWDLRDNKWPKKFEKLREHYETTGTTYVPPKHELSSWVNTQRTHYKTEETFRRPHQAPREPG